MECAAVVDVLRALRVIDKARHATATDLISRIVAMLTKLSRPPST